MNLLVFFPSFFFSPLSFFCGCWNVAEMQTKPENQVKNFLPFFLLSQILPNS